MLKSFLLGFLFISFAIHAEDSQPSAQNWREDYAPVQLLENLPSEDISQNYYIAGGYSCYRGQYGGLTCGSLYLVKTKEEACGTSNLDKTALKVWVNVDDPKSDTAQNHKVAIYLLNAYEKNLPIRVELQHIVGKSGLEPHTVRMTGIVKTELNAPAEDINLFTVSLAQLARGKMNNGVCAGRELVKLPPNN